MKKKLIRKFVIIVFATLLSGCGERGRDNPRDVFPPRIARGNQVPPSAPLGSPAPGSRSPLRRGAVKATLTLSPSLERKLRRSNKNPARIRAQLVRYTDPSNSLSWESVELSNADPLDETTVAPPFLVLSARRRNLRIGCREGCGYVLVGDITTQFTARTYEAQEIGVLLAGNEGLDLCSGAYELLCHFDSDSTRPDFRIYAWSR